MYAFCLLYLFILSNFMLFITIFIAWVAYVCYVRFLKQILNTGDFHGPIFCDSTRADKLTMTLKVEFLKYSINIHRVVKFVLKTVKSYKRDRQEKICIVNNKIKHVLS